MLILILYQNNLIVCTINWNLKRKRNIDHIMQGNHDYDLNMARSMLPHFKKILIKHEKVLYRKD